MPCWYYDKEEFHKTPSIRSGISYETECMYRKDGINLIKDIGEKMELGYNTIATGALFFHRFYMFYSFQEFPKYKTACCCLFLAGKVEETPKRSDNIIELAYSILTHEDFFQNFGEDPRSELLVMEKIILRTMKFDFMVQHPYRFIIKYAKFLKGNKRTHHKMVQMAWTFINDSLTTTLSLQWEPEVMAIAVMYLAEKLTKLDIIDWRGRKPHHLKWWDLFVQDLEIDIIEDIGNQILDVYVKEEDKSKCPTLASEIGTNNVEPIMSENQSQTLELNGTHDSTMILGVTNNVQPIKSENQSQTSEFNLDHNLIMQSTTTNNVQLIKNENQSQSSEFNLDHNSTMLLGVTNNVQPIKSENQSQTSELYVNYNSIVNSKDIRTDIATTVDHPQEPDVNLSNEIFTTMNLALASSAPSLVNTPLLENYFQISSLNSENYYSKSIQNNQNFSNSQSDQPVNPIYNSCDPLPQTPGYSYNRNFDPPPNFDMESIDKEVYRGNNCRDISPSNYRYYPPINNHPDYSNNYGNNNNYNKFYDHKRYNHYGNGGNCRNNTYQGQSYDFYKPGGKFHMNSNNRKDMRENNNNNRSQSRGRFRGSRYGRNFNRSVY